MIDYQIKNDMDIPLLAFCQEGVEIFHSAVGRVNGIVVGDIVFMVRGTGMDGHQPNAAHTQFLQIVQFRSDTGQIADTVTVGIAEGVYKDLVPGAIVIIGTLPQCVNIFQCLSCLLRGLILNERPRKIGGV